MNEMIRLADRCHWLARLAELAGDVQARQRYGAAEYHLRIAYALVRRYGQLDHVARRRARAALEFLEKRS